MNITGALYFPYQIIDVQNNAITSSAGCAQLIGLQIYLSNNVSVDNSCSGTGVTNMYAQKIYLVE
jgi:hypothetical protein